MFRRRVIVPGVVAALVEFGLVLAGGSGVASATSPCGLYGTLSSSGATETCTYTAAYGQDTFAVPSGIGPLEVAVDGGAGGAYPQSGYLGGPGGEYDATLTGAGLSGTTLTVFPGGMGSDATESAGFITGGGGGAASTISSGGELLIVAGGGGGCGGGGACGYRGGGSAAPGGGGDPDGHGGGGGLTSGTGGYGGSNTDRGNGAPGAPGSPGGNGNTNFGFGTGGGGAGSGGFSGGAGATPAAGPGSTSGGGGGGSSDAGTGGSGGSASGTNATSGGVGDGGGGGGGGGGGDLGVGGGGGGGGFAGGGGGDTGGGGGSAYPAAAATIGGITVTPDTSDTNTNAGAGFITISWSPASTTATALSSSVNPSVSGQSVAYTATVTAANGNIPTGTVTFEDGGSAISGCGSVTLSSTGSAQCTVTYPGPAGSPHSITAAYSGDTANGFLPSSSTTLSQVVDQARTELSIAPAKQGLLSITFSATLTRVFDGAPLSGQTVTFSVQGQNVCHATTNSSGVASCTLTGILITLGPASYAASYAGDGDYLASTGSGKL